jgi:hypothetical protein
MVMQAKQLVFELKTFERAKNKKEGLKIKD